MGSRHPEGIRKLPPSVLGAHGILPSGPNMLIQAPASWTRYTRLSPSGLNVQGLPKLGLETHGLPPLGYTWAPAIRIHMGYRLQCFFDFPLD
jgi:hypothetical protein